MNSITSIAQFRQRVIRYSEKHGVTGANMCLTPGEGGVLLQVNHPFNRYE